METSGLDEVKKFGESAALIVPFGCWMGLMLALPASSWSYTVRTVVTLAALIWSWHVLGAPRPDWRRASRWGVPAGLLVLVLWVWPERFEWYRTYLMYGYTANAPVDQSAWGWKAFRLFGSAFVISVAEELFFRRWLLRYAGFLWMIAIFALEHNRWLAGAMAGAIYGWLTMRKGLGSAIVAHIVTNLALGLYVLATDSWQFW